MSESLIQETSGSYAVKAKPAKKENLKQRAYLNSITGVLDYAASQITGFLVSPFIVNGLGSAIYGVWQMLGQITGYVNVGDTRALQVLKWTVAKKKETASEEELRSDVSSAFLITGLIVPISLIAGAIISWYIPQIIKTDPQYHNTVRITSAILILTLVVTKLFDVYESVLRGMNLGFKRMGLRALIVFVGGALKVWVVTAGYGLIGLALVQLVIAAMVGFSFYQVVKRNVPWFGFGKVQKQKVVEFSKLSGWYLADSTANILKNNTDKILLGFLSTPTMVSFYSLTMFLPTAILGLVNRIVLGIMPGIGKLLGQAEYEKVIQVRQAIINITYLLAAGTGVSIILFNKSFLHIWIGPDYFTGALVNALIVLSLIQDTFVKNDAYIISATLDLKQKVFLTVLSGVTLVVLSFMLIGKLEIVGLCIAMLLSRFILFIGQEIVLRKQICEGRALHLPRNTRQLIAMLTIMALAYYASLEFPVVELLMLVPLAPLSFALGVALFYFTGLKAEHRQGLVGLVKSIKFFKMKEGKEKDKATKGQE